MVLARCLVGEGGWGRGWGRVVAGVGPRIVTSEGSSRIHIASSFSLSLRLSGGLSTVTDESARGATLPHFEPLHQPFVADACPRFHQVGDCDFAGAPLRA